MTEKIDGTNAQIHIAEDGTIRAGSRNRWIVPGDDNYGFALWVSQNEEELRKLGPGHHYGEWWGCGIQRGYGLHERRFSLFNSQRWADPAVRPACCSVVPILGVSEDHGIIDRALRELREFGSVAQPGYMNPEGIVVYHTAARSLFKVLLEGDDKPKSQVA